MSWYDKSYRKLFFDFHSSQYAKGLASGFDAERWAQRLEDAHVQAVSVFMKGARGWSFYRKGEHRFVHPMLPEGLDMVEEQITALHRHGIRAIGYYATLPSEPLVVKRPEWRHVDGDGTPDVLRLCMHSGAFDEWMLPHVQEIVREYDLDAMFFDGTFAHGICYCEACQKQFAEATGGLDLPSGQEDPNYRAFVDWRNGAYTVIRQRTCDAIHAIRPEMPISFNWAYTMRAPEAIPESVGSLMIDIFPEDQCFNGSYQARSWAVSGKPFDIMSSAFLRWWGDWGCKPARAMMQEVATTIANGGLTWIGYQMNERFDIEDAVLAEMAKALAFVEEREPLLDGAEPWLYAGVLRSVRDPICRDKPGFFIDETGPRGVHRVLSECMVPYHSMQEEQLLPRLSQLSLVIIPDQRYLAPDVAEALPGWVRDGGTLIVTGLSGTTDAQGKSLGEMVLGDLLGVRPVGRYAESHGYVRVTEPKLASGTLDMAHMVECPIGLVDVVSDDVQVWAELSAAYLRTDGKYLLSRSPIGKPLAHPAVTVRRVGKGCAVYVAPDLFKAYQTNNQWNAKLILRNVISATAAAPPARVEAPMWLEVVTMQRPGEKIVHLVNHHGDRPIQNSLAPGSQLQYACTQSIPPIGPVEVRIACEQKPKVVSLEPGSVQPEWAYEQGRVTVQVPSVDIHLAIRIEA